MSRAVLALDLGTSGAKAAVFSANGAALASAFQPTALSLLPGGGAEQDPKEWWDAVLGVCQQVLNHPAVDRASVGAIGVTGQWSGTVAVGADGEPLHQALIWMDSRGAAEVEAIAGGILGIPYSIPRALRWVTLTGGAPAKSGKDSLAHILYLRAHAPRVYEQARYFLEPKDYINFRLTGVAAASYDSIALHWVTDNRNVDEVKYHPTLLGYAGLDREKLPPLCSAAHVIGTLRPQVADRLGLSSQVKVVAGTPDVHSTALGSGAVDDFEPHLYLGTSTWLSCHLPFKKTDILHNMASLPAALPGRYLLVNEQECAGACLTQLKDRILFAGDAEESAPRSSFADLDRIAAAAPPGSERLLFLPWLYGERSPVEDHLLRGGFFNYSLSTTRAHLVRAVLEGVAFNARWLLGYAERFAGRRFQSLRLVGGGGKSRLWCQIYADILDRAIERVEEPVLAGLRGVSALSFAALEGGAVREHAQHAPLLETLEPRREHRGMYDELFEAFLGYYKNNRRWLARLNAAPEARARAASRGPAPAGGDGHAGA
ncbi:MAG: FGGY-family carbohydrate kinase [Polyangiaceae bacterium]